jgi:hypothetical protein
MKITNIQKLGGIRSGNGSKPTLDPPRFKDIAEFMAKLWTLRAVFI